ncbi:hypothetical protein [Pontixanthobacter gangjinensis]|uniref:Uncharacterized protein n=1 Tax=Pontixanthobacter gangjinensis TaxID=1028742 RepID=A0A6I4SM65_9SPHN|nr:hypothetical protein [Pontixanthobacter gangjinensis]MXO56991.1 hypothetical protein [Pontixanthobacter gangjinensis]
MKSLFPVLGWDKTLVRSSAAKLYDLSDENVFGARTLPEWRKFGRDMP